MPYGSLTRDNQERVLYNAMVTDVQANVLHFGDLTPVHMAVIQSRLGECGVLLAISESSQQEAVEDQHRIDLNFSSPVMITDEQQEVLNALRKKDLMEVEALPEELIVASREVLPALWYADVAFTDEGLCFREGTHRLQYGAALTYISETVRGTHTQAHREFNVEVRSHLQTAYEIDMAEIPKPELGEQRRQQELDKIDPEFSRMLAKAQELQLYSRDLPTSQFVIAAAKSH